jgi:phage FluMu protein Com
MMLDVHPPGLGRALSSVFDGHRTTRETVRLMLALVGSAVFLAAAVLVENGVIGVTTYLTLVAGALGLYAGTLLQPELSRGRCQAQPLRWSRLARQRSLAPRDLSTGSRDEPSAEFPTNVVSMAARSRAQVTSRKSRDCRCACGRLVARATERGIEVKCGRCGRVVSITWEGQTAESPVSASRRAAAERSSKSNP